MTNKAIVSIDIDANFRCVSCLKGLLEYPTSSQLTFQPILRKCVDENEVHSLLSAKRLALAVSI
jgi:hypothetical protein